MKTRAWENASRLTGRLLVVMALLLTGASIAKAQPAKTLVQDTLYRADGSAAQGNLTIRWNAFTTSAGAAVAAGELTVSTGTNGSLSIPLIANAGATPAGGYYKVVVKLSDGTTNEESWVVPAAATTTLAAIRATVVPQSVAAQFVSREYVDGEFAGLAPVATTGNYNDLKNTPVIPNLAAPGAIGSVTPGSVNGTSYAVNGTPLASANLSDGATLLSSAKSYTNPGWLASVDGAKITGALNNVAIGSSGPAAVNATAITSQSVNGVLSAAQFAGADWVAKVKSAVAALPQQGGTVFVPASLSGSSVSSLAIPSNVNLEFDAGTFAMGGAINFSGVNNRLQGARGATVLQFSGAGDGIVIQDGANLYQRFIHISDVTLQTTNAAGGAAIRVATPTLGSPSDIDVERVVINASGSGAWAYGSWLYNLQYSHFYDIRVGGTVGVGLHMEASEENLFSNYFVNPNNAGTTNTATPTRCVEAVGDAAFGSTATFVGGGCYGGYTGSAIYLGAASGHNAIVHFYSFATDNPYGASLTDGAYIVVNGSAADIHGGMSSSLLVEGGGSVQAYGSNLGDVTLASTANSATIVGVSYKSITNNMTLGATLEGNTTWGGSIEPLTFSGWLADHSGNVKANTITAPSLTAGTTSGTGSGSVYGTNFYAPSGNAMQFFSNGHTAADWKLDGSGSLDAFTDGAVSIGTGGNDPANVYIKNTLWLRNGTNHWSQLQAGTLTATRTYSGPDQSGTLGLVITATTPSLGGSALAVGCTNQSTVNVAGATTGMACVMSPASGAASANVQPQCFVSASNTVTPQLCTAVAGTPAAQTYNLRVIQ